MSPNSPKSSENFHILVEIPQRPATEDLPNDAALVVKVVGGTEARAALSWLVSLNPHGGMKPEAADMKPKEALRRWRRHLFGIPEIEAQQAEERAKGGLAAVFRDRILLQDPLRNPIHSGPTPPRPSPSRIPIP